ncbi:MAG: DUF2103 domain-containing protein [Cyanobacteria bacterium J06626_23]
MGNRSSHGSSGRVVLTHSTHLPGLIALLHKLAEHPQVTTLTPAVIGRARSNATQFRLKASVPIPGGHKLIARKGKSVQEVFAITTLDKADLQAVIDGLIARYRP